MNKSKSLMDRIKMGLAIILLATVTGCVGYVDGGYVDGPVPGPWPWDWGFWGGGYYAGRGWDHGHDYGRGADVHAYSSRGAASRGVAHSAGGGAAHGGGGGDHR